MIGKPQWFKTRKYGGWGLTPATWQGWVYLAVFVGIVAITQSLPIEQQLKTIIASTLTFFLIIDVVDIMFRIKKDEREIIHEAISERNASWAIVFSLTGIFLYRSIKSAIGGSETLDMTLLIPIVFGTLAKGLTNLYLDKK